MKELQEQLNTLREVAKMQSDLNSKEHKMSDLIMQLINEQQMLLGKICDYLFKDKECQHESDGHPYFFGSDIEGEFFEKTPKAKCTKCREFYI